jgi:DNA polymerase II small subunit
MEQENNAQFIEDMFDKGILVNKELLDKKVDADVLKKVNIEQDIIVLNEDYTKVIRQQSSLVDWYEVDKLRVDSEKERNDDLYQNELQQMRNIELSSNPKFQNIKQNIKSLEQEITGSESNFSNVVEPSSQPKSAFLEELKLSPQDKLLELNANIEVTLSYVNIPKKYSTKDFTSIFLSRYKFIEPLLRNRQELQSTIGINRALQKKEREQISIIGIVQDLGTTKNGNIIAKIEDPTGIISVLFSKNKKDIFSLANELVHDEIIGVSGVCQGEIIFADKIVWPDIPETHELKKGPEEEYVLFLSDIHVGSKLFLKKEFNKFLDWINGNVGNEKQQKLAQSVKYIIIPGDAVDGVGIYPSQEEELEINDITGQYEEFARLIKKIPSDKEIVLCPGNHDVVHLAEPQPPFSNSFCDSLKDMPNLKLVSNPAIVNIGKKDGFPGFNVLMYHGYSFDYYVANVDSIRNNGGYHRSDLIMKFLLKRRHLAPSFKSTPYFPGHLEDPLIIRKVPDFFVTGHIHYCSVANYKGVTMISGSCWQDKTTFQEKLGHEPEPARVPIVNLKTREIKILKFN